MNNELLLLTVFRRLKTTDALPVKSRNLGLFERIPGLKLLFTAAILLSTTFANGQARNYQFERSTAPYSEISGGITSTATGDDGTEVLLLPFPFTYAGSPVNEITIGTNGFVRMTGGAIFASNWTNSLGSLASIPVLAPFWDDNNLGTGTIVYATTGSAPNRELAIEFRNVITSGSGSATSTTFARFKVILKEGSNEIVYHYGGSSTTTTLSGSIGMNSIPGGVGQFLSITPGANPTASTLVENNAIVNLPDSGVVYTFTPSTTCAMPWALASANPTPAGFTISWRNVGAASYQYAVASTATLPTSAGTSVTDTFATVTGLNPNTAYYVYVRAACTGGATSAWAGPFLVNTGGPVSSVASGLWSNPATWSTGAVPSSASDITISANDSVILDITTSVNSLTVNGVLGVNASATRILTVFGPANIATSGSINFGVPTTGTAVRSLDLRGEFNHAGTSNFASGNAVWGFSGTTAQTINQTGTLTNNAVGQIQINNPAGVTLAAPIEVGFDVTLVNGVFNIGSNLTFNASATLTAASQVRRSPYGSFNGTPTILSTVYNLSYVFFAGQTTALITEGSEIPASRTINALTISNLAGLNLNGNLTLTGATSALVLTSGIIHLPAGGKIISTASGFAPTIGTATSFVNGGFEINPNFSASTSRNIPVGSVVNGTAARGHVVLGALNTGGVARTITVMPVGAPSGSTVLPVTTVMGPRAIEITASGSIGATATVALNWDFLDAQGFVSTLANIRVVQASSLSGPWTARSTSTTTGTLTGTGTRTTTAISLANGNYFAWGTVSPNDVAVSNLISPFSGECFGQAETVVAVIRNEGPSINRATTPITIKGTVTTPSGTVVTLNDVVRNSGTFALGQTDTITFANAVNLVDSGNYVFRIFTDSLTGSIRTNDTLTRTVRSDAWTARANPAQVIVTEGSTVEVLRNGVPAAQAGVFALNQAIVRISEMMAFRTGTGGQPGYPSFIPSTAQDFLEITNFGDISANIGGWNLEIFGTGARTYSFPANTTIPAKGVLVLHIGPGTNDPANLFFNTGGANDGISSTSTWGVTIRNGVDLIDAVAFRGYIFPATAGVTATDWSGNSSNVSSAGMMLVNFDNNTAANWVISTTSLFTNIGTFNANTSFAQRSVSWSGPSNFTSTGLSAATGARNAAGIEQYSAIISNSNACIRTATATLEVMMPAVPVAGFSFNNNSATTGGVLTTVTLTDTSLNLPTSRRWSFTPSTVAYVNNTNENSVSPQVQFTQVGTYSVKLVVSNIAGSDSITLANAISVSLAYCPSNATNTADTKIDSVVLGTTVFGSAQTACEAYTNNTTFGVAASFQLGRPYTVQVKSGYCGTSSYQALGKVFIDLNKNGVFEPSEEAGNFGPLTAVGSAAPRQWFNVGLFIPANNDTGITRLRVIWQETTLLSAVLGCGTYTYGETEDYLIHLGAAEPFVAELRSRSTSSATIVANANLAGFQGNAGVVYGFNQNPTLSDAVATIPSGSTDFVARLSGLLTPNTTYYARAYLQSQNGQNVIYSNELMIRTFSGPLQIPANPVVMVEKPQSLAGLRTAGQAVNPGWGFTFDTLAVRAPLIIGRSQQSDSLGCQGPFTNQAQINGKIAVLYRGACEFSAKALAAYEAGAVGLVVINNQPGLINMAGGTFGLQVPIPVVMISDVDGAQLRAAIDNGEAVAFIGNKNGEFAIDLALLPSELVGPDATHIVSAMASQPGQYVTPLGAYVLNAGREPISQYYLQVTVLKDVAGQNPQQVYNGFLQLPPNILPGDFGLATVPSVDWGGPNFGVGNYTIRYNVQPWSGNMDGFPQDNVVERRFSITDSLYSKTSLDPNGNVVFTTGNRPGGAFDFGGAAWLDYQGNATRRVNALRFGFTTNAGVSLAGEPVEAQVLRWDDLNNDGEVGSNETILLGSGMYTMTASDAGVSIQVPIQNILTGGPGVNIVPGNKYLLGVYYWGGNQGVFLASDPSVNYTGTSRNSGRLISSVNNGGAGWNKFGFGPQVVFAIAAVIGDPTPPNTNITGMVSYDNNANTPMSNTMVMLFEQQNMLQQTTTDAAGMFDFGMVAPGSYTLRAVTNKMWGGVNSTDALAIARHFTSAAPLAGLRLDAADVNASSTVNATDALQVARRFTNQINSFPLGDWLFKADGFSHTNTQPSFVNMSALAVGDVNASYIPGNFRRAPLVALQEIGSVRLGSEAHWVTVEMGQDLELGAISLDLNLPQGVEVLQVKSRLDGGDFSWNVKNGVLFLSWYSLSAVDARKGTPVVDLLVRSVGAVAGSWQAGSESELANGWAEAHGPAQLRLPRLVDASKGLFVANAYPNPTKDVSTLSVNLPDAAKVSVRITDALGRLVFESKDNYPAGSQLMALPSDKWSAGSYQITVLYEGETTEVQQLRLQIVR